jgi:hypothetical protein
MILAPPLATLVSKTELSSSISLPNSVVESVNMTVVNLKSKTATLVMMMFAPSTVKVHGLVTTNAM